MRRSEFEKTEAYTDTAAHASEALKELLIRHNMQASVPPNCHVTFALIAGLCETFGNRMAAEVLYSLSDYCQKNPEVAVDIWDAIENAVKRDESVK